jgi:hypothetical protein
MANLGSPPLLKQWLQPKLFLSTLSFLEPFLLWHDLQKKKAKSTDAGIKMSYLFILSNMPIYLAFIEYLPWESTSRDQAKQTKVTTESFLQELIQKERRITSDF